MGGLSQSYRVTATLCLGISIVLILFRDLQLLYFIVLAAVRVRIACCSSNLLVFVIIGCYLCKVLLDLQLKSVSFLDLINVAYCKLSKISLLAE